MSGRKRAPEGEGATVRSSKAAKAAENGSPAKANSKGGRKIQKATVPFGTFKHRASPLQVIVTYGTESAPELEATQGDQKSLICSMPLAVANFQTGSYGWKGQRRFVVQLSDPEGGEGEKVTVNITINATVLGSKNVSGEGGEEGTKEDKTVAHPEQPEVEKQDAALPAEDAKQDAALPAEVAKE